MLAIAVAARQSRRAAKNTLRCWPGPILISRGQAGAGVANHTRPAFFVVVHYAGGIHCASALPLTSARVVLRLDPATAAAAESDFCLGK